MPASTSACVACTSATAIDGGQARLHERRQADAEDLARQQPGRGDRREQHLDDPARLLLEHPGQRPRVVLGQHEEQQQQPDERRVPLRRARAARLQAGHGQRPGRGDGGGLRRREPGRLQRLAGADGARHGLASWLVAEVPAAAAALATTTWRPSTMARSIRPARRSAAAACPLGSATSSTRVPVAGPSASTAARTGALSGPATPTRWTSACRRAAWGSRWPRRR